MAASETAEAPPTSRGAAALRARAAAALSIRRLGDFDRGRDNNLNLLRFVAASMVVVSHSYPLSGHLHDEPLARTLGFVDLGALAVTMFFAASGYLVARSFDGTPKLIDYVRARALRIVPAYTVAVLYAALLIGPVVTKLPVLDYLGHPATWRYIGGTLTFFGGTDRLPGVFGENPYPFAVNGSLWTLSVEVYCYALLALAGVVGALRRPWLALALAAALLALGEWSSWFAGSLPRSESTVTPRLAGTFVVGALAFVWRNRVPISPWIALALLSASTIMASTPFAAYYLFGTIAYTTLTLAYHPALDVPAFRRFGDYSYGIYAYAFPTQQAIAWLTGEVSPILFFALAYPVIVALAVASWRWIEEPALRFKRRNAADGAISARPT